MPRTKKKKAAADGKKGVKGKTRAARQAKEERRNAKLERRKREKKMYTADMWAAPAPSHLVAKLDGPKHSSKYHSYFEFAENTEKKKKKLEFKVTNNSNPPPGFKFVPIGDPLLTSECKELSRERDAMIFIVSGSKEENSKISEHIYRTGYHFRESIVDEAQEKVGETTISSTNGSQEIEPIPESQEEINKQADGAIRDLFPRIPHTDRQMIIDHAFKKGALFHGEPTVGLQPNIPLSRRVQLAVLAHIRHTHTRYDRLLRETTWINARKVVEPVCLDVLVKWRGDEETGRDQLDEILREVVIITDSEESEDSSEDEDSSDEEGEITSASSEEPSQPNSRNEMRPHEPQDQHAAARIQLPHNVEDETRGSSSIRQQHHPLRINHEDKKANRGFKRYQAAWDQAINRHNQNAHHASTPFVEEAGPTRRLTEKPPIQDGNRRSLQRTSNPRQDFSGYGSLDRILRQDHPMISTKADPYDTLQRPVPIAFRDKSEVIVRQPANHYPPYQERLPRIGSPYSSREQRPPLVVRGSPSHGLKDMLVPSIETGSSDAIPDSPHIDPRRGGCSNSEPEPYSQRVVEHRKHSSTSRQVILIDDGSPDVKRRRVVQEDDYGHFRPVASYSQRPFDSHLRASSVHTKDFLTQQPRLQSQSTQGLFRDTQAPLSNSAPRNRLPVYEMHPEPGYLREARVGFGTGPQQERTELRTHMGSPKPFAENTTDITHIRQPVNGDVRVLDRRYVSPHAEHNFGERVSVHQRPLPNFPVQNRISRSYEMDPAAADQAFVHSFSQSRIEPSLSRRREDFTIIPESSQQSFVSRDNHHQHYEQYPARLLPAIQPGPERSPIRYLERPSEYHEELRQSSIHQDNHRQVRYAVPSPPHSVRERLPPPGESSGHRYLPTGETRRPLMILE